MVWCVGAVVIIWPGMMCICASNVLIIRVLLALAMALVEVLVFVRAR